MLYVLDPCGDGSQDFTATGQLEVGTYRFGAALDDGQPSPTTIRMRFEMTFDTAAPAFRADQDGPVSAARAMTSIK